MKTKICAHCQLAHSTLYRIQTNKGGAWIFVCEACVIVAQKLPQYKYGGTWKGNRH